MRRMWVGWLFLFPTLFLLGFFTMYPFIKVLDLSFRELDLKSVGKEMGRFVALNNYRYLMRHDQQFWHSLGLTVLFVAVVVILEFLIGLGLALLLNREFKGKKFVIALAVIPTVMAPAAVGLMWSLAVNHEFGIVPYFLKSLGISLKQALLGSRSTALLTIMLMDIWQWTPFMFLIMLAGLHGLPKEPYEAAQVDRASKLQIFRLLTLPLLKPLIVVALLLRVIDAFKTFDQVYVLTGGGPGDATELLALYAYRTNFRMWNLGYGAAVALVVYFVVLVVTAVFYTLTTAEKKGGAVSEA